MAEPSVQVPVSLIERTIRLTKTLQNGVRITAALESLLSQLNPSAEPDRWSDGWKAAVAYFQVDAEAFHERNASAPPSVADMAPGTLTAEPCMTSWCTICERPIVRVVGDGTRPWRHAEGFHAHPAIGPLPNIRTAAPPGIADMAPNEDKDVSE